MHACMLVDEWDGYMFRHLTNIYLFIHRIVESFETVITVFAQQDNLTIKLTDITIVAELVSLYVTTR